jgi:Zn-dependent protease with chaperone function
MKGVDFDFQRYVERRKGAREAEAREGAAYAYAPDLRFMKTLDRMRPVRLAMDATVRLWRSVARAELLGGAVKASPAEHPRVDEAARRCADLLHIAAPTVYVTAPAPGGAPLSGAQTFGTDEDPAIVLDNLLTARLGDRELAFVLGRECGHLQNDHVVFWTARYYLTHFANRFVRWVVAPARLALAGWARRAEITCDRAGLICARDLGAAEAALLKCAAGPDRPVDVDAFLATAGKEGAYADLTREQPDLRRRILALRVFAESAYYRGLTGDSSGLTPTECDGRVAEILARSADAGSDS